MVHHLFSFLSERVAFRRQRIHRIEALSDAVFAIVMTLLVLDIRLPVHQDTTERELWLALRKTAPEILTFVLSFSVAGQFWSIFATQFNFIRDSDRNENVIAIFCLLPISLLPFSASFLSGHLWSKLAIGFYLFNIVLILVMYTLHWLYAYYTGLVKVENDQELVIHKAIMKRVRTAIAVYLSLAIICAISRHVAIIGMVLLQIAFTFSGCIELLHAAWKKWMADADAIKHRKHKLLSKT